jgi:Ca-activated chloride channel family protein
VSFREPWWLLALLALVPAVWAYLTLARRERRVADAFVARPLREAVLPARPRWRRHVPVGLFVLGAAGLLLAPSRPHANVQVPDEQATIVLATDVSGSMQATDVRPSRLVAVQRAARDFVEAVPDGIRIGLVTFNHTPVIAHAPTADHDAVQSALARIAPSGGTATGDALNAALEALPDPERGKRRPPQAIVLLSDGHSTRGRDAVEVARRARRMGVRVYTIALGTPAGTIRARNPDGSVSTRTVPPDPATMRTVAQISRGKAYRTADAAALAEVYRTLGSQLSTKTEKREVTAAVAGLALLLTLAGSGLSLRWFGRPA